MMPHISSTSGRRVSRSVMNLDIVLNPRNFHYSYYLPDKKPHKQHIKQLCVF